MPPLSRLDYDRALAEAIDGIPEWMFARLGDPIVRVEQAPGCDSGLETVRGLRLVVYREPSLSQARDLQDLHRLARADLVRAVVWELDLPGEHAHELTELDPVAG